MLAKQDIILKVYSPVAASALRLSRSLLFLAYLHTPALPGTERANCRKGRGIESQVAE